MEISTFSTLVRYLGACACVCLGAAGDAPYLFAWGCTWMVVAAIWEVGKR